VRCVVSGGGGPWRSTSRICSALLSHSRRGDPHRRPADPTPVDSADPHNFVTCLDNALRAFRDLRGGADYLVNAEVNASHRCVGVRFVQRGEWEKGWEDRIGQVEPALEAVFLDLYAAAAKSGGDFSFWGGTNFVNLSFQFQGPVREAFPEVKHLPWDEQYRQLLRRATWGSLRRMVFRFSNLAESFAVPCVEFGMSQVLIPSVGLCVHPWLFADHGLSVVATDAAASALAVLSEPERWPRLYSRLRSRSGTSRSRLATRRRATRISSPGCRTWRIRLSEMRCGSELPSWLPIGPNCLWPAGASMLSLPPMPCPGSPPPIRPGCSRSGSESSSRVAWRSSPSTTSSTRMSSRSCEARVGGGEHPRRGSPCPVRHDRVPDALLVRVARPAEPDAAVDGGACRLSVVRSSSTSRPARGRN
jgi:hypothetical protein